MAKDNSLSQFKTFQEMSGLPLLSFLKTIEKRIISQAMDESEGNVALAAKILGLNRTTLHMKLRQYFIEGKYGTTQ